MATALPAPLDVKLMNLTATVLFMGAVVGVLAAGGGWLLRHPAFAIGRIAVEGELVHTSAVALRANVAPQLVGNFFTLDLEAARRAFEQVPWVRRAYVHREFPSGLRVQLQEHDAVAYWGAEGSATLVNSHGEVFEAGSDDLEQDNLPRLVGVPERSAEMLRVYQRLAPVLAPLQSDIDTLERTGQGGWRATLDSGAVLELGGGDEAALMERVRRLVNTLPRVAQQQGRRVDALEYADLRHASGYALRLRGVTTVSGDAPAPKPAAKPKAPARPAQNNHRG
ncbi:cell division protein FtsQ/DivIB [Acidovorax sp. MR-S7]|jgi:cell division protein FtsQ|uniref:cell division protein FtsQ/DivIB n=1 Tax=unclassified Acidovorax TaxID=2684926 RepID=UPI000366C7E0|nr:cell division protein FtsQ/DivIB [Acidovorax sp. MR-S7]GAD23831.1 cell division septal protein [Acidovorax sp. MR-S7]